jgi:uncharacterized membrane protein YjfL (UPF0719 family)
MLLLLAQANEAADDTVFEDLGASLAWMLASFVLFAVGFVIIDLLTPGQLRTQVRDNLNAAVLVAAKMLAVAVIVFVSVWTAPDAVGDGIVHAGSQGLVSLAFSVVAFLGLDRLIPGGIRHLVNEPRFSPMVVVAGAAEIAVALTAAVALS